MIARLLDWLLHGSDTLTLPQSWLANREQLAQYTAYTMRQLHQGSIVKDAAATARARFWQRIEAQRHPAANVTTFRKVK